MTAAWVVIIAAVCLLALAGLAVIVWHRVRGGPGGDLVGHAIWLGVRAYCRIWHRAVYRGCEVIPDTTKPGGLIVVANHTGAIDPLLLQSACRFHIRVGSPGTELEFAL